MNNKQKHNKAGSSESFFAKLFLSAKALPHQTDKRKLKCSCNVSLARQVQSRMPSLHILSTYQTAFTFMPEIFPRPFLGSFLVILQNAINSTLLHFLPIIVFLSASFQVVLLSAYFYAISHISCIIQFLSTFKNYCSHLKTLRTLKVEVQFFSHAGIFHS